MCQKCVAVCVARPACHVEMFADAVDVVRVLLVLLCTEQRYDSSQHKDAASWVWIQPPYPVLAKLLCHRRTLTLCSQNATF